jgi:predicted transposase YbfD/YdcC
MTQRHRHEIKTGKVTCETVFHLSSAPVCDAACGAVSVREHWSVETKNHWRRDACCGEDATPGKSPFILGNLAVARGALLYFNAHVGNGNIKQFIQRNQFNQKGLFGMITAKKRFT